MMAQVVNLSETQEASILLSHPPEPMEEGDTDPSSNGVIALH